MAKTSASVVFVVLVVALFLNGYNAGESVERDNQPEKGEDVAICFYGVCPTLDCASFCQARAFSDGSCRTQVMCCCYR
ncbi:unnamed protein product [Lathyrus oleraceus]